MANGDENKPKRKLPPRDPDTGRFVKAQQQKNNLFLNLYVAYCVWGYFNIKILAPKYLL